MRSSFIRLLGTFVSVLIAQSALADGATIHDAWVMLPPPNSSAAAFMKIHNSTAEEIRLIGAVSPSASRIEMHRSVVEAGVARMERLETVAVPAGGSLVLAPRGLHLMLIDPVALADADQVEIELMFSDEKSRRIQAEVRRAPPGSPPVSPHHSHH